MIDVRTLKYDGRQRNHQNGLTFYFTRQAQVLSFLIDIIGDRKKKIKVTMHTDSNHGRPHIHINEHDASFAVDSGELLAGDCDNKTRILIENWIERHRDDLLQLWDIIKKGEAYQPLVEQIKSDCGFRKYGFSCYEPSFKTIIDRVAIWHNDEILVERFDNGRVMVIGAGDLFVGFPAGYPEDHIVIDALDGAVQVKRLSKLL